MSAVRAAGTARFPWGSRWGIWPRMPLVRSWRRYLRPITIWVPTWPVVAALLSLALLASVFAWRSIHGFLAPVEPSPGARVVVIEAWAEPEFAEWIKATLTTGNYERYVVVGTPLDRYSDVARFGTSADLWAARLSDHGVASSRIEVVRVPNTARHRTAHAALGVARHLAVHPTEAFDLLTFGPHGRRSWTLYQEAQAPGTRVGVVSLGPLSYDAEHWWTSSAGVRTVLSELIAYVFVATLGDEVDDARRESGALTEKQRHVVGPQPVPALESSTPNDLPP